MVGVADFRASVWLFVCFRMGSGGEERRRVSEGDFAADVGGEARGDCRGRKSESEEIH